MRNRQFSILEIIAILLVIIGHLNSIPGIIYTDIYFPVYGYHMALFFFISGYFFKNLEWKTLPKYFIKKIKHLILPLIGWNIVYAFLANTIYQHHIVNYFPVQDYFSAFNLFVAPFIYGDQYLLNLAGWFVSALFVVEIMYGIIFCAKYKIPDWAIATALLCIAVISMHIDMSSLPDIISINIKRTCFFIVFFHFGYCYKTYLEKYDICNNILYFAIWGLLLLTFNKFAPTYLYFAAHGNFNGGTWQPFVSSFLGIMFWLRISKIITHYTVTSGLEKFASENTWSIMLHHLFVLFMLNWICIKIGINTDINSFQTSFWNRQPTLSYWVYLLALFFIPLIFQYLFNKIKNHLYNSTRYILNAIKTHI